MRMPRRPAEVGVRAVVVGIDPSLTGTGLVALDAASGDLLSHIRIQPKTSGVRRLADIRSRLNDWLDTAERDGRVVEHICMEGYAFAAMRGGKASQPHSLGEAGGTIKLAVYDRFTTPVRYVTIPTPQSVKKFVTGKGTAAKDQVTAFVLKKWGEHLPSSDEADAYVLARIGQALFTPDLELLAYETDVIRALKDGNHVHQEMPDEEKYARDVWR